MWLEIYFLRMIGIQLQACPEEKVCKCTQRAKLKFETVDEDLPCSSQKCEECFKQPNHVWCKKNPIPDRCLPGTAVTARKKCLNDATIITHATGCPTAGDVWQMNPYGDLRVLTGTMIYRERPLFVPKLLKMLSFSCVNQWIWCHHVNRHSMSFSYYFKFIH